MNRAENVAAVRRFNEAMEAGDEDTLTALAREIAHPDGEWTPLVVGVEGKTYRGSDGWGEFFADFLETFEVRYADPEFRSVGEEDVLMLCTMELRGRGSGVDVSQEMGALFEFEGGRLRRGRAYPSHAEALAAAAEVSV